MSCKVNRVAVDCNEFFGIEFLNVDAQVSLLPSVKRDSFAFETRAYVPAVGVESTKGFVSFRMSSRANFGVGVGYQLAIGPFSFEPRLGMYVNPLTDKTGPHFGLSIGGFL